MKIPNIHKYIYRYLHVGSALKCWILYNLHTLVIHTNTHNNVNQSLFNTLKQRIHVLHTHLPISTHTHIRYVLYVLMSRGVMDYVTFIACITQWRRRIFHDDNIPVDILINTVFLINAGWLSKYKFNISGLILKLLGYVGHRILEFIIILSKFKRCCRKYV